MVWFSRHSASAHRPTRHPASPPFKPSRLSAPDQCPPARPHPTFLNHPCCSTCRITPSHAIRQTRPSGPAHTQPSDKPIRLLPQPIDEPIHVDPPPPRPTPHSPTHSHQRLPPPTLRASARRHSPILRVSPSIRLADPCHLNGLSAALPMPTTRSIDEPIHADNPVSPCPASRLIRPFRPALSD